MGVVDQPTIVTVACDTCGNTGTSTNTADPLPTNWITIWGPPHFLGKFYFCTGACYDEWLALHAEPPEEEESNE